MPNPVNPAANASPDLLQFPLAGPSPCPEHLRLPYHPALEKLLSSRFADKVRGDAHPVPYSPDADVWISESCYEFWSDLVLREYIAFIEIEEFFSTVNASYRICPLLGVQEERCGQCITNSRLSGQFPFQCPHEVSAPHPPVRTIYRPSATDLYNLCGQKIVIEALIQLFLTFFNCYQDVPTENRLKNTPICVQPL